MNQISEPVCRICNQPLTEVIDFGKQPLGNGFLMPDQFETEYFFPMRVGFSDESMMFQLIDQPAPEQMFHENYAFFSGTSKYMDQHFSEFAEQVKASDYLNNDNPFVVELGCNDGILLKNFARSRMRHLGVEPAENVAAVANDQGVQTISQFFSEDVAKSILEKHGHADAILAANVMCHIPDIRNVLAGIRTLLKSTGVVTFEDPYLGDVVNKTSYDQVYDEHVFLFSAHSVQYLFGLYGMELIDVSSQKTHGGSMRYQLAHAGSYTARESVSELLEQEKELGLNNTSSFEGFNNKVKKSRDDLVAMLCDLKSKGKTIVGYGATSKSTTILNYCNVGPELIEYISDTTPIKQGKFTPGMHIPVKPYDTFQSNPPDYAFLFAWNHAEEIMAKEQGFMEAGGRWIVHVPEVGVL